MYYIDPLVKNLKKKEELYYLEELRHGISKGRQNLYIVDRRGVYNEDGRQREEDP